MFFIKYEYPKDNKNLRWQNIDIQQIFSKKIISKINKINQKNDFLLNGKILNGFLNINDEYFIEVLDISRIFKNMNLLCKSNK